MKAMAKALGSIAEAAKADDVSGQKDNAQIVLATATDIPSLFPAGTGPNDPGVTQTRALPDIWAKKDAFDAEAKRLGEVATALSAAVDAGDATATNAVLLNVGPTCKGCHDGFRKPVE
jgi:cytochrome c556